MQKRVVAEVRIVGAHAFRHGCMLWRHPVLAHLNDRVHFAPHVSDRVNPALVLDRARHLAAGPPHNRGRQIRTFDPAVPNAPVRLDVHARSSDGQDGLFTQGDPDLGKTVRIGPAICSNVFGQRVLDHGAERCRHHANADRRLGRLGDFHHVALLITHCDVHRSLLENLVPILRELLSDHPVPNRSLLDGFYVLFGD